MPAWQRAAGFVFGHQRHKVRLLVGAGRIDVPAHLGDSAYADGFIYGACDIKDANLRVDGKPGLVRVWNEDLEVVPFPEEQEDIVSALASLGAVILTNRKLSEQILETLHSFVKVMVEAIETRSAYNANHTKNMVRYADKFLDYMAQIHDERALNDEERDSYLMSVTLEDLINGTI